MSAVSVVLFACYVLILADPAFKATGPQRLYTTSPLSYDALRLHIASTVISHALLTCGSGGASDRGCLFHRVARCCYCSSLP